MTRAYGWNPNPAGHRFTPLRHLIGGAVGSTPKSVDFRSDVVIRDQSITSSCVGFAHANAAQTALKLAGTTVPLLSAYWVYKMARVLDAPPNAELVDTGSEPNQAVRAIQEYGIALESDCPSVDPGLVNDPPKLLEVESAYSVRLNGAYGIFGDPTTCVSLLRAALAAKAPPTIALIADQAFEDYTGAGLYTPGGALKGGHDVFLAGYDTMNDGSTVFFLANSWGTLWGDHGIALMPESCVARWADMNAMSVRRID